MHQPLGRRGEAGLVFNGVELGDLSRSAAYEWHNRYEEEGIEGLRDRPLAGRQPRVDAVTSARFKERIVAGAELERDGVVAFGGSTRNAS